MTFIYELRFDDGSVYVGYSTENAASKEARHRSLMSRGRHKNLHVQRKYDEFGLPEFIVVEEGDHINYDYEVRRIHRRRLEGVCLNIAAGGPGAPGVPQKKWRSNNTKARNRIATKKLWQDPTYRSKVMGAQAEAQNVGCPKGYKQSDEHRSKISQALRDAPTTSCDLCGKLVKQKYISRHRGSRVCIKLQKGNE